MYPQKLNQISGGIYTIKKQTQASKEAIDIAGNIRRMPKIGIFGSHSAEQIGTIAKAAGFETVIVVERGRDALYTKYNRHLYDHVIKVDSFPDMMWQENQQKLNDLDVLFWLNRSLSSYAGYDSIEEELKVPLYGNRLLQRAEERSNPDGQVKLNIDGGLDVPMGFNKPSEIDRLVVVKVQQAENERERAFFYAVSEEDFEHEANLLIDAGIINKEGLKTARIEEFILGARFNAVLQYYALKDTFGNFDFCGLTDREQVNLQGYLNLPAKYQLKLNIPIKNEEIKHIGATLRESKKTLIYDAAEKLMNICRLRYPPGMIGINGIQGAVGYAPKPTEPGRPIQYTKNLKYYVYDDAFRVTGDPPVGATSPEMLRLSLKYGFNVVDPLILGMMEIQYAFEQGRLAEIVT